VAQCRLYTQDVITIGDASYCYVDEGECAPRSGSSRRSAVLAIDVYHPSHAVDLRSELDQLRRFVIRAVVPKVTNRSIRFYRGTEATTVQLEDRGACISAFERIVQMCEKSTRGLFPLEICGGVAEGRPTIAIGRAFDRLGSARLSLGSTRLVAPED
jgi:hypothetical protein